MEYKELIASISRMKDFESGREGCTYGDTHYDSLSVVYGYNNAIFDVILYLEKQSGKQAPPGPEAVPRHVESTFNLDSVPDLSSLADSDKDKFLRQHVEMTAKYTLQLFLMLGLKSHIETMIVNKFNQEEFILSFKKVEKWEADNQPEAILDKWLKDFNWPHWSKQNAINAMMEFRSLPMAELMSLKQSILESSLKQFFPKKDISFHDKVVMALGYENICYNTAIEMIGLYQKQVNLYKLVIDDNGVTINFKYRALVMQYMDELKAQIKEFNKLCSEVGVDPLPEPENNHV